MYDCWFDMKMNLFSYRGCYISSSPHVSWMIRRLTFGEPSRFQCVLSKVHIMITWISKLTVWFLPWKITSKETFEETEEFPYCHEICCKCKCLTLFCEEDPLQSGDFFKGWRWNRAKRGTTWTQMESGFLTRSKKTVVHCHILGRYQTPTVVQCEVRFARSKQFQVVVNETCVFCLFIYVWGLYYSLNSSIRVHQSISKHFKTRTP